MAQVSRPQWWLPGAGLIREVLLWSEVCRALEKIGGCEEALTFCVKDDELRGIWADGEIEDWGVASGGCKIF